MSGISIATRRSLMWQKSAPAWQRVSTDTQRQPCTAATRVQESSTKMIVVSHCSCQNRQVASAYKLQVKAANILPVVELARTKQDPINRGYGARCLYRPSPAGAMASKASIMWQVGELLQRAWPYPEVFAAKFSNPHLLTY